MCVTDCRDMTLARRVALNPNPIKQSIQTQRVCRQFEIGKKRQKVLKTGRKRCGGKRRNYEQFLFPLSFQKNLYYRDVKTQGLFWRVYASARYIYWVQHVQSALYSFQAIGCFLTSCSKNGWRLVFVWGLMPYQKYFGWSFTPYQQCEYFSYLTGAIKGAGEHFLFPYICCRYRLPI